jgi:hypothetical protein
MLADASISRAGVSKAKPQRGPTSHRGTRTPVGGRKGEPTSGSGGAAYRLQERSSGAAEEECRGPPPRRRVGGGGPGAASRGGAPRRGDAPRRWGADVDAAELAGGGRRRCVRVGEERRVGEGRRIEKSLSSGTGVERRGGGDDDEGR